MIILPVEKRSDEQIMSEREKTKNEEGHITSGNSLDWHIEKE